MMAYKPNPDFYSSARPAAALAFWCFLCELGGETPPPDLLDSFSKEEQEEAAVLLALAADEAPRRLDRVADICGAAAGIVARSYAPNNKSSQNPHA